MIDYIHLSLSIYFRFIGAVKNIINAYTIKFCQSYKSFCWRDSLSVFVL